jgi:hypothetical protein
MPPNQISIFLGFDRFLPAVIGLKRIALNERRVFENYIASKCNTSEVICVGKHYKKYPKIFS